MIVKGGGAGIRLDVPEGTLAGRRDSCTDGLRSQQPCAGFPLHGRQTSLKVGDKLYTHYIEGNVRARRLSGEWIFQTNSLHSMIIS